MVEFYIPGLESKLCDKLYNKFPIKSIYHLASTEYLIMIVMCQALFDLFSQIGK